MYGTKLGAKNSSIAATFPLLSTSSVPRRTKALFSSKDVRYHLLILKGNLASPYMQTWTDANSRGAKIRSLLKRSLTEFA